MYLSGIRFRIGYRDNLRIAMKFMLSNSRPYLSSLDSLSASRRVPDQP